MARNKARTDKLVRAEDGTFGNVWGYIMDTQPIEMCLQPHFFDNCRSNLLPADILRVTELKGAGPKKTVTASCTLIVMRKDDNAVTVQPYEGKEIYRYEEPDRLDEPIVPASVDFMTIEEYIKSDGRVEKPQNGPYEVHTDQGIVSYADTYGEAMAIAKGDKPLNK